MDGNDASDLQPKSELALRAVAMPAFANAHGDIFGSWLLTSALTSTLSKPIARSPSRKLRVERRQSGAGSRTRSFSGERCEARNMIAGPADNTDSLNDCGAVISQLTFVMAESAIFT